MCVFCACTWASDLNVGDNIVGVNLFFCDRYEERIVLQRSMFYKVES